MVHLHLLAHDRKLQADHAVPLRGVREAGGGGADREVGLDLLLGRPKP